MQSRHGVPGDRCGQAKESCVRTKLSICLRKMRFPTAAAAQDRAAQTGLVLRPYRCDRCRQFHLTSRTKGKWVARILL